MSVTIKRKNPGALQNIYKGLKMASRKVVAVGFPKGKCQAYPDGTEVAFVAAVHVYGLAEPRVPQRDFMALAIPDIIKGAKPFLAKSLKVKTDKEAMAMLNAAGQAGKAAIQQAITDLDTPPNAPSTIAIKGDNNPLIDTGHMRQSVTWEVREK